MSRGDESNLSGRIFLCLIGAMLLLAGSVFEWLLLRSYQNAKATREWPQVEALVLESEVAERQFIGSPKEYSARVVYKYSYGGLDLTSGHISPRGSKWSKDADSVNEMLADYPVGRSLTAWINPDDVDIAILKHDTKAAGYTLWFPALIMLGGGGIIVGAFRRG